MVDGRDTCGGLDGEAVELRSGVHVPVPYESRVVRNSCLDKMTPFCERDPTHQLVSTIFFSCTNITLLVCT